MKSDCPIQFHGIDHVVLQVTDIEKTLHFYTKILGLAVERVIEDMGLYQLRCGRNLIDLRVLPEGTTLAGKDERGVDHVCLLVHGDFDAIVNYLKANDWRLRRPVRTVKHKQDKQQVEEKKTTASVAATGTS